MTYANRTYVDHARREVIPQERRQTGTVSRTEPDDCPCTPRPKPPRQGTLDAMADEKLAYGPGWRPGITGTRRRASRKPPSLSRWTPYGKDKENPRFTAPN